MMSLTKLGIVFIGITVFALVAGCSQEQQAEYTKQTIAHNLPKGAELIEHVPSNGRSANMYTIYKFRGQCFLRNSGKHHMDSLANIRCPDQFFGKVSTFTVDPDKVADIVKAWEDK